MHENSHAKTKICNKKLHVLIIIIYFDINKLPVGTYEASFDR